MLRRPSSSFWIVTCVLEALVLTAPSSACVNSITEERVSLARAAQQAVQTEDDLIAYLVRGEEQLRLGKFAPAADALDTVKLRLALASPRIQSRFERTVALLTIRTEGRWPQKAARKTNGPRYRAEALADAVAKLRQRALEVENDPVRQSDLGEALAAIPKYRAEARHILEALAREDLLTSAHAYAALAQLRGIAGDQRGSAEALAGCRLLDAQAMVCGSGNAPRS